MTNPNTILNTKRLIINNEYVHLRFTYHHQDLLQINLFKTNNQAHTQAIPVNFAEALLTLIGVVNFRTDIFPSLDDETNAVELKQTPVMSAL